MSEPPQVFRYRQPPLERAKVRIPMHRTATMLAEVQVVREGGDNNLHTHTGSDGFWIVLEGRVRFYGENNEVIAELGRHESILIPHGFAYWFESASPEPLEIVRVGVAVPSVQDRRVDLGPLREWQRATRAPQT